MSQIFKKCLCSYVALIFSILCCYQSYSYSQPVEKNLQQLYLEGISLIKADRLQEAQDKFEEVLEQKPSYEPARHKIYLIQNRRQRISELDKVIADNEELLKAKRKWFPPEDKGQVPVEEPRIRPFKTEQQLDMEKKAEQIIPEINFTDAHLRDVIQYLSRLSGINIILDEDVFIETSGGKVGIPQKVDLSVGDVSIPKAGVPIKSDRVTISLKNIPLIAALKYILRTKGLSYRIDEYAIVISHPSRLQEEEMETRYYHLVSGIGGYTEYVAPTEEGEFEWETEEQEEEEKQLTIKDVIIQSGVPFPPGSKIFLDQRTGTLIVRNTPSNLSVIEDILRTLDVTPYQIEIEAKFTVLTRDTAQELGLEWMLEGAGFRFGEDDNLRIDSDTTDLRYGAFPDPRDITGREGFTRGLRFLSDGNGDPTSDMLSLSGVLTDPEFRVIIHALNQTGNANLLSAPKVTTLNNQRAKIRMVEEFRYPDEYEIVPPTIAEIITSSATATSENYILVTPGIAVPIDFISRDIGIVLNVTPSVGADRKTVTLTLIPEISEFVDWIDYGIHPTDDHSGWNDVPILKPIFRTRRVTTSVVINDGETVVLGGLIEENIIKTVDKVPLLGDIPLLGRMFRNETKRNQLQNLFIFVTARLLSPSGSELRKNIKKE